MRLLSIVIFFMGINQVYAQEIDIKYTKVYHFLDSIKKQEFNVSPIIKYISTSPFNNQPRVTSCNLVPADIKDTKLFYSKYYFQPYTNPDFDSVFSNKRNYSLHLLFSKPVENILLAELRKGSYNLRNLNKPYFGTAEKYLFIFNDQNEIIKFFKDEIKYN